MSVSACSNNRDNTSRLINSLHAYMQPEEDANPFVLANNLERAITIFKKATPAAPTLPTVSKEALQAKKAELEKKCARLFALLSKRPTDTTKLNLNEVRAYQLIKELPLTLLREIPFDVILFENTSLQQPGRWVTPPPALPITGFPALPVKAPVTTDAPEVVKIQIAMNRQGISATAALQQFAPHLKQLDLSRSNLQDPQILAILQALAAVPLPHLLSINLNHSGVSDETLLYIFQHSPKLQRLEILDCGSESSSHPSYSAYRSPRRDTLSSLSQLPDLAHLEVSYSNIDDFCLARFALYNPKIRLLSLRRCFLVTDFGIQLLSTCKNLSTVYLRETACSDEAALELLKHTPSIRKLDVNHCPNITKKLVETCKRLYPHVTIVSNFQTVAQPRESKHRSKALPN